VLLDDILSAPIGFEGVSFQPRTLGIGRASFDFTIWSSEFPTWVIGRYVCNGTDLRYVIVATSELVVNLSGPEILVGNRAPTRVPLSMVKRKTLLNPPSRFSYLVTLVAPGHRVIALSQSAEKLKSIWREFRWRSSL
jgi:hypothetical protein